MKKKNIIIMILVLTILVLPIVLHAKIKEYVEIDGVKYAILVNGETANSFPSGNYKVDVECTNADACWNVVSNKLVVKNISGSVTCDIDFESINNNDYLNTYIINKLDTTQGDGKVIQEQSTLYDYENTETVKSFGSTPVFFQNTSSTSTTQTNTNDYWTFNSSTGVFTSDPSKMTLSGTSNYYHVYMKVPEEGFYQICYTIAQSPNAYNRFYIAKNTSSLTNISSSTSSQVGETCYHIGYLAASDYLNISERGYSGTNSPVVSFRIEKPTTYQASTGYRYEGKNPNNYILFNDELWRIIGVFETEYDTNNDGIADGTSNLVKIIRNYSIGSLAWDNLGTNDWPNSTLYHLLNEQYYDWETNKNTVSTNCYGHENIPGKCDYTITGINSDYRSLITRAKWYLGGAGKYGYSSNTSPPYIYSYERNQYAIYNGRSASTFGYVGLMYLSDYLYGVLASDCARTTTNNSYSSANCAGKDWLYGMGYEWTISPYSPNDSSVYYLYSASIGKYQNSNSSNGVRPTLYLSPDVYRVSGTGTITDPYIIGMAS